MWLVFAFLLSALLIPVTLTLNNDYEVLSKGQVVAVKLTELPDSFGYIRFAIDGKVYHKRVSRYNASFQYKIGDAFNLRYLPGHENDFLFVNENPIYGDIWGGLIVLILIIVCIYYAYTKTPIS